MADSFRKKVKRRQSMMAPLYNSNNDDTKPAAVRDRRKTMAGDTSHRLDKENGVINTRANKQSSTEHTKTSPVVPSTTEAVPMQPPPQQQPQQPQKPPPPTTTPSKTPSKRHHRIALGTASSHYFKGIKHTPKTPGDRDKSMNVSFEGAVDYDGSVGAAETSMLSFASSSSGSDEDMLNKSTLSDTTELSAPNFVLAASSKQMWLETAKSMRPSFGGQHAPGGNQRPFFATTLPEATEEKNIEEEEVQVSRDKAKAMTKPPLSMVDRGSNARRHTLMPLPTAEHTGVPSGTASREEQPPRRESWAGTPADARLEVMGKTQQYISTLKSRRAEEERIKAARLSTASSNLSMEQDSPSVYSLRSQLRGLASPALTEDNRVVKRGMVPSPMPPPTNRESDVTSLGSLFDGMQDSTTATERGEESVFKENRRETVDTSDLGLLLSPPAKGANASADISDFDLRSPEPEGPEESIENNNIAAVARQGLQESREGENTAADPKEEAETSDFDLRSPDASMQNESKASNGDETVNESDLLLLDQSLDQEGASPGASLYNNDETEASALMASNNDTNGVSSVEEELADANPASPQPLKDAIESPVSSPASPTPKSVSKLTPSKLGHRSPRRVPNPKVVDSPARNTRSKSKASSDETDNLEENVPVDSPARNTRSHAASISPGKKNVRENKPVDSPARNTRSRSSIASQASVEIEMATDNRSLSEDTQQGEQSFTTGKLLSSFRKKGNASARKSVAFGSPDVLRFNASSPPMSATPHRKARSVPAMEDSTVEINHDMRNLMGSLAEPSLAPGVKGSHCHEALEAEDHTIDLEDNLEDVLEESIADSSQVLGAKEGDESQTLARRTDQTVELEQKLDDVLGESTSRMDISMDTTADITARYAEDTIGLEANIGEVLLAQTQSPAEAASAIDDSITSKRKREVLYQGEEEDNTVELECDMAGLLEAMEDEDGQKSQRKRRRKSSISSRRFSLVPRRRSSLGVEVDISNDISQSVLAETSRNDQVAGDGEQRQAEEAALEEITLKPEEVLCVYTGTVAENSRGDIITKAFDLLQGNNAFVLKEGFQALVEEICGTTEAGLATIAPTFFTEAGDGDRDRLLRVQQFVRNAENQESLKSSMEHITSCYERNKRIEWSEWLASSSEHLLTHAFSIEQKALEEVHRLRSERELVEKQEANLYEYEARKVRRARRKSLEQRKINAGAIQQEIKEIEDQIARMTKLSQNRKARNEAILNSQKLQLEKSTILSQLPMYRLQGEQAEKKWTMAKRVSVWALQEVSLEKTAASYLGPCAESCASVAFTFDDKKNLCCTAATAPSIFGNYRIGRCLPPKIVEYWQAQNQALSSFLRSHKTVEGMKRALRANAWSFCRLEAVCTELCVLHRRYNMTLTTKMQEDGEPLFQVHVKFSRCGSKLELLGSFDLTSAYPFGSMSAKLDQIADTTDQTSASEDELDLDSLESSLTKNAKPGFGYLSRAFGVMSAFYQKHYTN